MKKKFDFDTKSNKATVIDCFDCENYYTGTCDAKAGGCNAYTPTRKITMEKDIRTIIALCKAILIIVTTTAINLLLFH